MSNGADSCRLKRDAARWCVWLVAGCVLASCAPARPAPTYAVAPATLAIPLEAPPAACCEALAACTARLANTQAAAQDAMLRALVLEQQAWIKALVSCGPAAVPPLTALLARPNPVVTDTAAAALGELGEGATEAVPSLLQLAAADPGGWAAWALGQIGDPRSIALLLRTPSVVLKRELIERHPEVIDRELAKLFDDPGASEDTKQRSLSLLFDLRKPSSELVAAVVRWLDREMAKGPPAQGSPLRVDRGQPGSCARPSAEEGPSSSLEIVLQGVGWLGPEGRPAIPLVKRLLQHERLRTRLQARYAFIEISGAEGVPLLLEELGCCEDAFCPANIIEKLGRVGPAAASAVPVLIRALSGGAAPTKPASAWALGQIGDEAAIAPLGRSLLGRDTTLAAAAEALGRFGAKARSVLPQLEHLAQGHWSVRVRASAHTAANAVRGRSLPAPEPLRVPGLRLERTADPEETPDWWLAGTDRTFVFTDFEPMVPPSSGPCARVPKARGYVAWLEQGSECLIGEHRGEWGGGSYVLGPSSPEPVPIEPGLEDGVVGLLPSAGGIWAVHGLSHLGSNTGGLQKLVRDSSRWHATDLVELPALPVSWARLPDGRLVLLVAGGLFPEPRRRCDRVRAFVVTDTGDLLAIAGPPQACEPDIEPHVFGALDRR